MTVYAVPIVNLPYKQINDLVITNNLVTPNTKIDVSAGQCRDSTNVFDMVLDSAVTINAANNGVNGLDTGSFAASKVYAVHLISDPTSGLATAAMISLSMTAPLMPFGYSAFRLIGFMTSDASTHFLPGYWYGKNNDRIFHFDAVQATAVTAGAQTSYTAIDLSAIVPTIEKTPVYIYSALTPGAASQTLKLQPAGGTGDAVTVTGQVTAVVVSDQSWMLSRIGSAKPEIAYKVSNNASAVAVSVLGYAVSL